MRIIQTLGTTLAFIAVILLYFGVYPVSPYSPEDKIAEAGWLFTYVVTPILYLSALLVVPSSLVLFSSRLRLKYNIKGKCWQVLWGLNILISMIFIVLFGVGYLLM